MTSEIVGLFLLFSWALIMGAAIFGPEIKVSLNRRKQRRLWKLSKRRPK